ncbi:hypothetical protein ILUMI_21859 [Ignelater luminosus]|uniref:Uncharacterized protein n=1 Tax=Ignelater luminosus TaxID=2038154 RepID=A0A8K0CEW8_IGNLU|nr:hypothetical protein ILUMI_21859 [Ignelater luminosus]
MSDNEQSIEVTSRKRAKHDESYQKNKVEEARVNSEFYRNYKNVLIPAKRPAPCHCKKKCTEKLLDVKKKTFSKLSIRYFLISNQTNYLYSELNVKIMHSLFLEKHPEFNVKYEYYNKVFRKNFSLSFGRPLVDVCNDCETLSPKLKNKSLNDTAKRVAAAELLVHKRRSKKFYNALKVSKELCRTEGYIAAVLFDFMQDLQLPRYPGQDLFYLSQLTINVFGVHNMRTNNAVFFMYHEDQTQKSPNKLQLFCDNCPEQNKNHAVMPSCLLPSDRDFGLIKRKLKKINKIYALMVFLKSAAAVVHMVPKQICTDFDSTNKGLFGRHYRFGKNREKHNNTLKQVIDQLREIGFTEKNSNPK